MALFRSTPHTPAKPKKKKKTLGLGGATGVVGQQKTPAPSPGFVPKAYVPTDKSALVENRIKNISTVYKESTGFLPSPAMMLGLIDSDEADDTLALTKLMQPIQINAENRLRAYAEEQVQKQAEDIQKRLAPSYMPVSEFWGDYVSPGEPDTDMPWTDDLFSWMPFQYVGPGAKAYVEKEQRRYTTFPAPLPVKDMLENLQGVSEDRFRREMVAIGHPEDSTTKEMAQRYTFGYYLVDALDGDAASIKGVVSSGYLKGVTDETSFRSWVDTVLSKDDEERKQQVYTMASLGRDPRDPYADWAARIAQTEWAPQAVKQALEDTIGKMITDAAFSAMGDLGFAQATVLSVEAKTFALESAEKSTGAKRQVMLQAAAAANALEKIVTAPAYIERAGGAVGATILEELSREQPAPVKGLGPHTIRTAAFSLASSEEDGVWEQAKRAFENLGKHWKESEGKLAAWEWAESAGLDTSNDAVSLACLLGELTFQGLVGRGLDTMTKGTIGGLRSTGVVTKELKAQGILSPSEAIAQTSHAFDVREFSDSVGIPIPAKDAAELSRVHSPGLVDEYWQTTGSVFDLSGEVDFASPSFSVTRRMKKLQDTSVTPRQRARLLPLRSRTLDLSDATRPDRGVFEYATYHNLPLETAKGLADDMVLALAGEGKLSPFQVAEKADRIIGENYKSLPASKWFQKKVGKPDATRYDELQWEQNRERGYSDAAIQNSYMPSAPGFDSTLARPDLAWRQSDIAVLKNQERFLAGEIKRSKREAADARSKRMPEPVLPKPYVKNGVKSVDVELRSGTVSLDAGIAREVKLLDDAGYDTFGSHSGLKTEHAKAHPSRESESYIEFTSGADDATIRAAAEKHGLTTSEGVDGEGKATTIVTNPRVNGRTVASKWNGFVNDLVDAKVKPRERETQLQKSIADLEAQRAELKDKALASVGTEPAPMTDRDLANHYTWKYDQRLGALLNSDLDRTMTARELDFERNQSLGAAITPWYDLVNGLVPGLHDKPIPVVGEGVWRGLRGRSLQRSLETAQVHGVDQATKVRKMIALSKLSTIAIIVGSDELLRSMIWANLTPKQAMGVISRRLEERGFTHVTEDIDNILASTPELSENFFTTLLKYKRKPSRLDVDPTHPNYVTAVRQEVSTFNAADGPVGSQVCRDWMEGFRAGEKEYGTNAPEAYRYATEAFKEKISTDPFYTQEGKPGYELLARRNPGAYERHVLGVPSLVDDWVKGIDAACAARVANPVTRRHFEKGPNAVKKEDFRDPTTAEAYGTVPLVADMSLTNPNFWQRIRVNPNPRSGKVVGAGASVVNTVVHPVDAMFNFLGDMGVRLKRETFANFYETSLKHFEEKHPTMGKEDASYAALRVALNKTKAVSYMVEHSFLEEEMRNVIMFLPAYKQFAAFWGKKAIENVWTTALLLNAIEGHQEEVEQGPGAIADKAINLIPGAQDKLKSLVASTTFFDFTSKEGELSLNQILPPMNLLGQDILGLASSSSKTAKSLYETINGGYAPNAPIHGPLEAVVWSMLPDNWRMAYEDATEPLEGTERLIDSRTKRTVMALAAQYAAGEPIDYKKAIGSQAPWDFGGTRGFERAVAFTKFAIPVRTQRIAGTMKVAPKMNNGRGLTVDLDRINEAQRQYLSAPDAPMRSMVLDMYPDYRPIADAYTIGQTKGEDAQNEYLAKHKWVIPFVVTVTTPNDHYSGPEPLLYEQQADARERIDARTMADSIKARVKKVESYVLAKDFRPQADLITDTPLKALNNPKLLPSIPKEKVVRWRNYIANAQGEEGTKFRIKKVQDAAYRQLRTTFGREHKEDLDRIFGKRGSDRMHWDENLKLSGGGATPGWKAKYKVLNDLWSTGEEWAQELVKNSGYYPDFQAQNRENEKERYKAQIGFAISHYKSSIATQDRDDARKTLRALGFEGTVKDLNGILDKIGPYLDKVDSWQSKKDKLYKAGKLGTDEYKAIDAEMEIQLEKLRKDYPLLSFYTTGWLKKIGLTESRVERPEYQFGGKKMSPTAVKAIRSWQKTQSNMLSLQKLVDAPDTSIEAAAKRWQKTNKNVPTESRETYDEYMRAYCWSVMVDVGKQCRDYLSTVPNYGWRGASLESKTGKQVLSVARKVYKLCAEHTPAFKSEVEDLFGDTDIVKYMIDPSRY